MVHAKLAVGTVIRFAVIEDPDDAEPSPEDIFSGKGKIISVGNVPEDSWKYCGKFYYKILITDIDSEEDSEFIGDTVTIHQNQITKVVQ